MSKNQKSKNYAIAKLYKILDYNSKKDIRPKNEKYFVSLSERLKEVSGEEIIIKKKLNKENLEESVVSLKPKVIVHAIEVKKEEPEPQKIIIEKEEEKREYQDEDIFEVKKISIKEPKFVEVKPKTSSKEEIIEISELKAEKEKLPEWDSIEVQKKEEKIEELPELESVSEIEIKKEEPEPFKEIKEEKKEIDDKINFCPECGTKFDTEVDVCSNCGKQINEIPSFIPVKEVEKEKPILEWEPIEIEKPEEEKLSVIEVEEDVIIQAFKDIDSIDIKMASLLYDNGITTIELLNKATIKDLTKIKGINKKIVRKIKKELKKRSKESKKIKTIEKEEIIEEEIEKEIEIEKEDDEWVSAEKLNSETSVWEPIEDEIKETEVKEEVIFEEFTDEGETEKSLIDNEIKVESYKDIKSIDSKTAVLLFDNGYTSVDALIKTPVKDLTKIKGIKRKTAKQIKKELEKIQSESLVDSSEEKKVTKKDNDFQNIKEELDTTKQELKTITKDLNKKEKNIQKLQEDLDEKINNLESKKTELYNRDEEIKLLQNQSDQSKQELETGHEELNKKQEEIDKIQKELEQKTVDLSSLTNEIEEKDEKINQLQDLLKQNKQELETENLEINSKEKEIENIQKELEEKTMNLSSLTNEIEEKDEKINQLQEELKQNKQESETGNVELNKKEAEIEEIKKNLLTKTDELDEKQRMISDLKSELAEKQKEIEIKDKDLKINTFKGISSIDDKTAILLFDNGITSIDYLISTPQKRLTKIKGIKRKTAKEIKMEIDQISEKETTKIVKTELEKKPNEYFVEKEGISKETEPEEKRTAQYTTVENGITKEEAEDVDKKISDEFSLVVKDDDIFEDINSIDEKTSKLLLDNGISTIDALKDASLRDLTRIKGIKRKTAKKIKNEIETLSKSDDIKKGEESIETDIETITNGDAEWEYYDEDLISDTTMKEYKGFKHKDYTLYKKEIQTKSGKKRIVRFFSKAEPDDAEPIELPKGYEIKKNKKTGLPYLRKKK